MDGSPDDQPFSLCWQSAARILAELAGLPAEERRTTLLLVARAVDAPGWFEEMERRKGCEA